MTGFGRRAGAADPVHHRCLRRQAALQNLAPADQPPALGVDVFLDATDEIALQLVFVLQSFRLDAGLAFRATLPAYLLNFVAADVDEVRRKYFDCSLTLTGCNSFDIKPFLGVCLKERRSRWNGGLKSDWRNFWRMRYSIPEYRRGCWIVLERFAKPFAAIMESTAQQRHLWEYIAGLFSDVKRKSTETIAYFHDQDRQALQKFIGQSLWDDGLLIEELAQQIGRELGESDGVLVFDPSGFKKQGKESVGVARQWLGRLGKIDNGQVGIYLGYVSRKEHALVDVRLYLNKEWAKDKPRRKKCGVPSSNSRRRRTAGKMGGEWAVVS